MNGRDDKLSHASLQQAANWYVLLQDENPSVQLHAQWRQWLDLHAEHQAAWHYVERIGQRFAPLQGERQLAGRVLKASGERSSRVARASRDCWCSAAACCSAGAPGAVPRCRGWCKDGVPITAPVLPRLARLSLLMAPISGWRRSVRWMQTSARTSACCGCVSAKCWWTPPGMPRTGPSLSILSRASARTGHALCGQATGRLYAPQRLHRRSGNPHRGEWREASTGSRPTR